MNWRTKYLELTYEAVFYRPYEAIIVEATEQVGITVVKAVELTQCWSVLTPRPESPKVLKELASCVSLGIATNSGTRLAEIAVAASGGQLSAV